MRGLPMGSRLWSSKPTAVRVVAAEVVRWLSIFRPEHQRGSCRHPVSPSGLPTVGGSISNSSVNRCCWFRQTWSAPGTCATPTPWLALGVLPSSGGDFYGYVSGWTPDGSACSSRQGHRPGRWLEGRGNVWIDHVGRRRSAPHGDRGRSDADVSTAADLHARLGAAGDVEPGDLREIWSAAADGSDQRRDHLVDAADVVTGRRPPHATTTKDGSRCSPTVPGSEITSVMPANRDFICCPYNQPSWQPLRPAAAADGVTGDSQVAGQRRDGLAGRAFRRACLRGEQPRRPTGGWPHWRTSTARRGGWTTSISPTSGPLTSGVRPLCTATR